MCCAAQCEKSINMLPAKQNPKQQNPTVHRREGRARAPLKGIAVAEGDLRKLIMNPSTLLGRWNGISGGCCGTRREDTQTAGEGLPLTLVFPEWFSPIPLELCSDDWGRSKGLWSLPAVLEHPRAPAGAAGHLQASVGLCPHLAMAAPCLALLQLPGFGFAAMGRS